MAFGRLKPLYRQGKWCDVERYGDGKDPVAFTAFLKTWFSPAF